VKFKREAVTNHPILLIELGLGLGYLAIRKKQQIRSQGYRQDLHRPALPVVEYDDETQSYAKPGDDDVSHIEAGLIRNIGNTIAFSASREVDESGEDVFTIESDTSDISEADAEQFVKAMQRLNNQFDESDSPNQ
jgi:hypothetical protein